MTNELFISKINSLITQYPKHLSVEGEHHEKAVELLKAAPASVKLVVRYTPKVKRIQFMFKPNI